MPVIAVDFDGVLHDTSTTKPPELGRPIQDATTGMMQLRRKGYKLIVFSSRAVNPGVRAQMSDWLKSHRILFDDITNEKPIADYYIDDKAITFKSWPQTLQEVK